DLARQAEANARQEELRLRKLKAEVQLQRQIEREESAKFAKRVLDAEENRLRDTQALGRRAAEAEAAADARRKEALRLQGEGTKLRATQAAQAKAEAAIVLSTLDQ